MTDVDFLLERLPQHIPATSREGILALEKIIENDQLQNFIPITAPEAAQEHFPVKHYFADGVYSREIFIPTGSIIVGKIHRHAHMNVISKGKCVVVTEFGIQEIQAPYSFISEAGVKRVVLCIEDTIWTTFHGVTEEQCGNLDAIENRVICKTYEEFDSYREQLMNDLRAKIN